LRVAVYDVAPYGSVDAGGLFSGASVDLWGRVGEDLRLDYRFTSPQSGWNRGRWRATAISRVNGWPYTPYADLHTALTALVGGRSDAVVNSVGALHYLISTKFRAEIRMPSGVLAPAYMAFALPQNFPIKKSIDRAMVRVTASQGWRSLEDSYFDR
jgi:ABC-type amino acid transport substrate-binding protein